MKKVIVRMPPSPTGGLHLGTVRTLLFNFLWARKNDGKIIFRWEDTDQERSEKKWETEILHGLEWLGIGFDEMTRQSEQADFHGKKCKKCGKMEKFFLVLKRQKTLINNELLLEKIRRILFGGPLGEMKREKFYKRK